ncbi:hypothetical protein C1I95_32725, partial [Micromonospora craterilacus]
PNTEKGEDTLSTLNADVRAQLGLAEDADDAAVLAALAGLKTQAEAAPAKVAAAAAASDEMKAEIGRLSGELAEIRASAAADTKKAIFDKALGEGRIKGADRKSWEDRYDRAPEVTVEILASIAPQTHPTVLAGHAGNGDADFAHGDGISDTDYNAIFGIDAKTGA